MIQFGSSNILWLLIFTPLLVMFLRWRQRKRQSALSQFGSNDLVIRLLERINPTVRKWKTILPVLVCALLALALARPQYGTREEVVKRKGMDIVVAVDTSDSMMAEDIRPNRLMVAKREISALIDRLEGDRIALVPFSGDAFVQCPLTLDYGAAQLFLQEIDTNTVSKPGTAIGRAIEVASRCFVQEERKYKLLILITDGEDTVGRLEPIEIAKKAASEGIRIYTIGVGSRDGEPIPMRDEKGDLVGYRETKEGGKVLSRLDESILDQISRETDGNYFRATSEHFELDQIYEDISELEEKDLHSSIHTQGIDRYQFFLLPALILLLLELLLSEKNSGPKRSAKGVLQ